MDWNNHLNSLIGIICELKTFFDQNQTYSQMLRFYQPDKLVYFTPLKKRVAYKFTCLTCKEVQEYDQFQCSSFYQRGKALPKKLCKKCKLKKYNQEARPVDITLNDIVKSKITKHNNNSIISGVEFDDTCYINSKLL